MNSAAIKISSLDFNAGAVLNIDKPEGITSFGVVRKIKAWTKCRKVGHAGTLDPMATGVLLVVTGRATKSVSSLVGMEKEYTGVITLGIKTDTDDAEGRIIEKKEVELFPVQVIEDVLKSFEGEIEQIPPMYSAIKVKGRPLYRLARKGEVIERSPRKVVIYSISLDEWNPPSLKLTVRCSKGTYIRALARDVGDILKTGGHLSYLRRTKIGDYKVDDSYQLQEIREALAV